MTKIAFFDIDGTMVNVPNGMLHPSKETRRVLQEFRQQGNYIVVATARTMIPESVRDMEFDGYICSDGHYIEFKDEVLVNNTFTKEQIEEQIKIFEEHNGSCSLGGYSGTWVSSHTNPYLKRHHALYEGTDDLTGTPLIMDVIEEAKVNSIAAVFGNPEDMFAAKKKLPTDWAINAYGDPDEKDVRMDVHLSGFSKGTACEFLYKHLNIDRKETYAFGDGDNDIEMLQLVGHGIAMGNAAKHIQNAASDVTDTVDNEGIAKAFKKYLNI
ncbi:MAG: HAD family hydrolase [Coprobacillaceae bacterium]